MYDVSEIYRINKILCQKYPFYGVFMMSVNKYFTDDKNVAETAGCAYNPKSYNFDLIVNDSFWKSLEIQNNLIESDNHKAGIIMHECLHIIFYHLSEYTYEFENQEILNIAMDLEVNQYIPSELLLSSALNIEQFNSIGYNLKPKSGFKYYYEELMKRQDKISSSNGSTSVSGIGKNANKSYSFDTPSHIKQKTNLDKFDEETSRSKIKSSIETAMSAVRGNVPGDIKEYVLNAIKIENPKVKWNTLFKRFIGKSTRTSTRLTHMKLNKRVPEFAGLRITNKTNVLVCIDTSGSVDEDRFKKFWNELYHIHKLGYDIDVIECDAKIQNMHKYKRNEIPAVAGRGGTDYTEAISYFNVHRSKYSCCVYFTDGECDPPNNYIKGSNLLWMISNPYSDAYKKLQGQTIVID